MTRRSAKTRGHFAVRLSREQRRDIVKAIEIEPRLQQARRDEDGVAELLETATLQTFDTILIKTGRKPRRPKEDWWGDSYWRTSRTNSDWEKKNAEDEPVK